MSLQVEKLEKNMAKLTVEVPAEQFEAALKTSYNKNKNKFNIPGFRKGKAPQAMIEKMYGVGVFYEDAASALSITHTPPRIYVPLCSVFVVTLVLIAWVLTEFTNSDVPWSDSFTTALSIVGIWMLARKYVEQWLVWIVVDVVCCGLYVYKELYFTAGLYGLYALIAIGGYKKWIRMMEEEK